MILISNTRTYVTSYSDYHNCALDFFSFKRNDDFIIKLHFYPLESSYFSYFCHHNHHHHPSVESVSQVHPIMIIMSTLTLKNDFWFVKKKNIFSTHNLISHGEMKIFFFYSRRVRDWLWKLKIWAISSYFSSNSYCCCYWKDSLDSVIDPIRIYLQK